MWKGIANYFFQYDETSAEEGNFMCGEELLTVEDDDWLFVDVAKKKPVDQKQNESAHLILPDVILQTTETRLTPSGSQMDESWYITPPPCFTSDAPLPLETSPLENLLIEHPSMSVYGSKIPSLFDKCVYQNAKRSEIKSDFDKSDSELVRLLSLKTLDKKNTKIVQQKKKELYPLQPSFIRTDLIRNFKHPKWFQERIIDVENINPSQTKWLPKQIMDENIYPGQQAKWLSEQKQLQRSFLNRTNRVCHYQASAKKLRRKDRRLRFSGINNNRNC